MRRLRQGGARGGAVWTAGAAAAFFLQLASHIAVTPIGEGLDVYGHWARVRFTAARGRAPTPNEMSVSDACIRLRDGCPGPDHGAGGRYAAWAARSPAARRETAAALVRPPAEGAPFVEPNYEAQQAPLYYTIAAPVALATARLSLDVQHWILGLWSAAMAAAAVPALRRVLATVAEPRAAAWALLAWLWFPNFLPFLGRIANDPPAFALMSWAIALCTDRPMTRRRGFAAAGLLAAAVFTKAYALVLAPAVLAALLCRRRPDGGWDWRAGAGPAVAAAAGVAAALAWQAVRAGHALPLIHVVGSATVPLRKKLAGLAHVDPLWLAAGLARGGFWCGHWSFVSPGRWFYLPLLAAPALLLLRPRAMWRAGAWLDLRRLWFHYAVLAAFIAAMVAHAALFLHYPSAGGARSGNEGWYLNSAIAAPAAILLALAARRFRPGALRRAAGCAIPLAIAWNLLARLAVALFWNSGAPLRGPGRVLDWRAALDAAAAGGWDAWLSCPGVIRPAALTSALPLVLALALTAWLAWRAPEGGRDGEETGRFQPLDGDPPADSKDWRPAPPGTGRCRSSAAPGCGGAGFEDDRQP